MRFSQNQNETGRVKDHIDSFRQQYSHTTGVSQPLLEGISRNNTCTSTLMSARTSRPAWKLINTTAALVDKTKRSCERGDEPYLNRVTMVSRNGTAGTGRGDMFRTMIHDSDSDHLNRSALGSLRQQESCDGLKKLASLSQRDQDVGVRESVEIRQLVGSSNDRREVIRNFLRKKPQT